MMHLPVGPVRQEGPEAPHSAGNGLARRSIRLEDDVPEPAEVWRGTDMERFPPPGL
jgi:hypothetical protein